MKIIVFMKNWVGDAFFQFPAIRLIRERYPSASITCIAPPRCAELLQANPDVNHVLEFDEKSTHRSWWKRLMFVRRLRALGPWDQGYLFHRSKTRAMIFALAGVKERFGYARGRSFWLTQAVAEPAPGCHHVDYFLELLRGCGYGVPEREIYHLPVASSAEGEADRILNEWGISGRDHFVCFHLGANWEPKRWPPAHFAALADLIHDAWHVPVVITGSPGDLPLWDAFRVHVQRARIFSLIGKTTLPSLAALYAQAAFVVSGDSGPMHVATAVGTPVVALFGPTDPVLTGPRGLGEALVFQHVPPGIRIPFMGDASEARHWLAHISPEEVFTAIEQKSWIA